MTELEALIEREEEKLRQCLDEIGMIENNQTPIPNDEDLKQLILEKENRNREMIEKFIATLKERAARV